MRDIGADAFPYLVHVCSHRLADGGDRVNETDLHREEGIGGVLNEFGALRGGHNKRGRMRDHVCVGAGNRPAGSNYHRATAHK